MPPDCGCLMNSSTINHWSPGGSNDDNDIGVKSPLLWPVWPVWPVLVWGWSITTGYRSAEILTTSGAPHCHTVTRHTSHQRSAGVTSVTNLRPAQTGSGGLTWLLVLLILTMLWYRSYPTITQRRGDWASSFNLKQQLSWVMANIN